MKKFMKKINRTKINQKLSDDMEIKQLFKGFPPEFIDNFINNYYYFK